MKKTYIGDGVYMAIDSMGAVHLTTENGMSVTNIIILEDEHMELILKHYKAYATS